MPHTQAQTTVVETAFTFACMSISTTLATKYIAAGVSERKKHSPTNRQNTFHFVLKFDIIFLRF